MRTTDAERFAVLAGRLLGKLEHTARTWPVLPAGERIALAVSGDVCSLALVWLTTEFCRRTTTMIELVAVHISKSAGDTGCLPCSVAEWMAQRGVDLKEAELRLEVAERHGGREVDGGRVVRRTLLEAAEATGAGTLAVSESADDMVEDWLGALVYRARAETVPPVRPYLGRAVTLVRPLCELRRRDLERLVELGDMPGAAARTGTHDNPRQARVRAALEAFGPDQSMVRQRVHKLALAGLVGLKEERR